MGIHLQRAMDIVKGIASNQRYFMRQYLAACATHEQILALRKTHLYEHPDWDKLPRWGHERLLTIWDLYFDEVQSQQLFTYVWKGQRRCTNFEPNFPHGEVGRADQAETLPDHCFPVLWEGMLYWLPYSEKNRQADIAADRIPKALADAQNQYPLKFERLLVAHNPNGTPYLAMLAKYQFVPTM